MNELTGHISSLHRMFANRRLPDVPIHTETLAQGRQRLRGPCPGTAAIVKLVGVAANDRALQRGA